MTPTGTYTLGPQGGRLTVHTGRSGAAARAGHDLTMEVQRWDGTVRLADDPAQSELSLRADARSLRVLEGTGGMTSLGDDDRANIQQTIDDEVLKGTAIAFRSTSVAGDGSGRLDVGGELELWGRVQPIAFELSIEDDGRLTGRAVVTQSAFGVKPYSALFGTLKVADEVAVSIDARLPVDH